MKKTVLFLMIALMLCQMCVFASDTVTMYALDGRTASVPVEDVQAWRSVGWYDCPMTIVYALDGRYEIIKKSDLNAWLQVGWYLEPAMYVYSLDGRMQIISQKDLQAWKAVGWYEYPVTVMYALDGRTEIVYKKDVEAWKAVGWYTEPVGIMDMNTVMGILYGRINVIDFKTQKEVNINTLPKVNDDYNANSYPYKYTLVDVDGNGQNELIIEYSLTGCRAVITMRNGKPVSYYKPLRGMNSIKVDGSSSWSNSAFDSGSSRYYFTDYGMFETEIYSYDTGTNTYSVNGVRVNKYTCETALRQQANKPEVAWNSMPW